MKIQAVQVSHTYNPGTPASRAVLKNINLEISEQRIGIIGHNGSGKSTFVRMLDSLITPTSGRITVDGFDTAKDAVKIRRQTGFLFTDPDSQIIMPTVKEDIGFGLRPLKLSKEELTARSNAQLEKFGLTPFADQPAHLLSGGQKQLLALAAVLITNPKLIIMDEPTTLLDIRNSRMIASLIDNLDQMVILATHHLHLLENFDRVIVFDAGEVVADGTPAEAISFYNKLMDRTFEVSEL
jgi:biotin transport system ATP-binding protein